ncbi:unnamed protein product [Ascophyllum nodosum]
MSSKVSATTPAFTREDNKWRGSEQKRTGRQNADAPLSLHTLCKNPLCKDIGDGRHYSSSDVSRTCSSSSSPSSNSSCSPDSCTQGHFVRNARQDVISGSHGTRSFTTASTSVKSESESEDTVLRMVDLKHGGNSGALGTLGFDIADNSGGDTNSGDVTQGKEPPFRGHGFLSTATILKLVTILAALGTIGLVWLQYDSATGRLCPDG